MNEKSNTKFHNDKMPKGGSHCIYLSVIFIDSVFKMDESYYLQVVLEEFNYIVSKNKRLDILLRT